ncbi:hypothetical protein CJU89_6400 [Yarrowia sp. B02]|nr:hypothetical protein CJU89_6400 [Yarrowia sp. B02]
MLSRRAVTMLRSPVARVAQVQVRGVRASFDKAEEPMLGDYPDIDPFPAQLKNPYKKYDDQQDRRNLNEPLSVNDDLYDMWSPDRFTHFKNQDALKYFIGFLTLFFGGSYVATYFVPEKAAIPREFPYEGLWKESGGTEKSKDVFAQRSE